MKYLVAGLGNMGAEYVSSRHNIGFAVIDAYARDAGVSFEPKRYAYKAEARYKGRILVLIKPSTYMNLSGRSIRYWLKKENITPDHLLVIVDDIALPLGQLRMKKSIKNWNLKFQNSWKQRNLPGCDLA